MLAGTRGVFGGYPETNRCSKCAPYISVAEEEAEGKIPER